MANQRIIVYLDTSDISRFADIGTDHERATLCERDSMRQICACFQRYVKQGDIEIRYSGVHIAEIAASGSAELAFRKAQVIERLCGSLCFRPFEEIWIREVWHLIQLRLAKVRLAIPYDVCSDHGIWLFKSTDNINLNVNPDRTFRKLMKDFVPLNRRDRRALKAQLWQGDRFSDRGLELSGQHWPEAVGEIAARFPVNDAGQLVGLFGRLLSGSITMASFEMKFVEMLLRPTQIVRFAFEMDELREQFPQFVVAFGETVLRAVAELRAKLAEIPHSPKKGFAKHVPGTVVRGPALKAALKGRRPCGLRMSDEQISTCVEGAALGKLPAVDLVSAASRIYIAQHATMRRSPKISDGPDLLHLTYLPYCHVFRADAYTADVLRQCGPLPSATVARSLEELPLLIEQQLREAAPHPSVLVP